MIPTDRKGLRGYLLERSLVVPLEIGNSSSQRARSSSPDVVDSFESTSSESRTPSPSPLVAVAQGITRTRGFRLTREKFQAQFGCEAKQLVHMAETDWAVTRATWEDGLRLPLAEIWKRDVAALFATMFPLAENVNLFRQTYGVKEAEINRDNDSRTFMKRVVLAVAIGDMHCSSEDNMSFADMQPRDDIPVAGLLCHGQRIIFDVEPGALSDTSTFNDLLFSRLDANILALRPGSSHSFDWDENGEVIERKLSRNKQANVFLRESGVDIAFGGLGAPTLSDQKLLGPRGIYYNTEDHRKDSSHQHGHVYVYRRKEESREMFCVGLETSGPGIVNMFDERHTIESGVEDQTLKPSITATPKMARLPLPNSAPAEYGGKKIRVSAKLAEELANLFQNLDAMFVTEQKLLFKEILVGNGQRARQILKQWRLI